MMWRGAMNDFCVNIVIIVCALGVVLYDIMMIGRALMDADDHRRKVVDRNAREES